MEIEIFDAKRRFKLQVTQDNVENLKDQKMINKKISSTNPSAI